jgi:hypothetical protein
MDAEDLGGVMMTQLIDLFEDEGSLRGTMAPMPERPTFTARQASTGVI